MGVFNNLDKAMYKGVGIYGIPALDEVTEFDICEIVDFRNAKKNKDKENIGIHFFIHDYKFECIWNNPDKYMDYLSQFKYVLAPDFSLYTDLSIILQRYNHYRKHWLGRYMLENGIKVIPTIAWSDERSYEWCFDGEPKHSVVAVSSVGCMKNKKSKELFIKGYNEMIKRLEPSTILFFGKVPSECKGNIINFSTYQDKFRSEYGWARSI